MKRRLMIALSLCLLLAVLTGCWNRREIDTLSVIEAVGVDKTDDGNFSLSFQLLKPSGVKSSDSLKGDSGGGSQKAVYTLTSTGKTIFDAFRNATQESGRKLFIPFNRFIVFGEDVAKDGIDGILDFFYRDHETRPLAYLLVTKGKAKDIIDASSEQENIPAVGITDLLEAASATSKFPITRMYTVEKILSSATQCVYATGIDTITKKKGDAEEQYPVLTDTAVFSSENKLLGWANWEETRGLLWVNNEVQSGIVVITAPTDESKKVALEIIESSSSVEPEIKDGKPSVTIKLYAHANLGEQLITNQNLTEDKIIDELEKKLASAIIGEVNAAISKILWNWGADCFDFGEQFYRKYPSEWQQMKENWDEEIKTLSVSVNIETVVDSVGMIMTPQTVTASDEKK